MQKESFFKRHWLVMLCGLLVGGAAVLLTAQGNPKNMGFCIACFLRDIAGALGLQSAGATEENVAGIVSNFRPEIIGIIIGSCIMALVGREFKPKGGSSPFTRFFLGIIVMMGALVFLGCPLRMVIRIGGGDMNAIMGLIGFILGILIGILLLKKNFSLGRAYKQEKAEGFAFPLVMLGLFVLSVGFGLFRTSLSGPGSNYAPWIIALLVALVVGALAQRSRLCMVGGLRDAVMFKEFGLLAGFVCIVIAVLVGNAIQGTLSFSFEGQPIAHTEWLWNMLGMTVVGWGCCLLGGCPLRQLVLAGEGNTDSAVTVFGMILGGALSHTLGIASSGTGTGKNGPTATIICLVILAVVSITNLRKEK